MKRLALSTLSLLFVSLSLVACGDDTSSSSAPSGTAQGTGGLSGGSSGGSSSGGSSSGGSATGQGGSAMAQGGESAAGGEAQGAGGETQGAGGSQASGGQSGGQGGDSSAGGGASNGITFACPGFTIMPGMNSGAQVGEVKRAFMVDFPADTTKPMAVIFSWHGYGDTVDNHRAALGIKPENFADFPFVLVTPDDLNRLPPKGLDWTIFDAGLDSQNDDGEMFEAVLGCLSAQYPIDGDRIYSIGFSAGAIMTNMLHSRYQSLMAATLAYSGAWFNDEAESSKVNTLGYKINFNWPALDPAVAGTALITHGGATDSFGQFGTEVINFENSALAAIPFLQAGGRTVIDCVHNLGHTVPPDVRAKAAIEFFSAHKRGAVSPWKGAGLPAGFPSSCTLK